MAKIHFYRQTATSDCGPTSLMIVLSYFSKYVQEWEITNIVPTQRKGWDLTQYATASVAFGLKPNIAELGIQDLNEIEFPLVISAHNHYVVLYKVKGNKYFIADPDVGRIVQNKDEFIKQYANIDNKFVTISFATTPIFQKGGRVPNNLMIFKSFLGYYSRYTSTLVKVFILLIIVTLSQTVLPFISRAIVDDGIGSSSWSFIKLLIVGNVILVLTSIFGSFVQTFLVTHISSRVKIYMLDDYLRKILGLKYEFFIRSSVGDLLQRVSDNERIQTFFSYQFFSSIVSILFLFVFSLILLYFNYKLFLIYAIFALFYIGWVTIFLKQRKKLDFRFWHIKSENDKHIINVYDHIIDIKGFNYINKYRKKWASNIIALYKQNIGFLNYTQTQDVGGKILLQAKDLILTYLSCSFVLDGNFTLGTLFAVQYILGALNTPLTALADFMNQMQLSMISLNRIHGFNEQPDDVDVSNNAIIPYSRNVYVRGVIYKYPDGSNGLSNVYINFEHGKKYGLVGSSGCGKSTLLKLICGIIHPMAGEMLIGTTNVRAINWDEMRKYISIDLQENKLFEGSILENIVGDFNSYDEGRLLKSVEVANLRREIENLPASYNTLIEGENKKLSKGQAQRVLIARAVYREADIYLFDEIANCLNLVLEKRIIDKIDEFLANKTRIYVTHRPEVLENADMIYAMNNGTIVSAGKYGDLHEKGII